MITAIFSEFKITEFYCMTDDFQYGCLLKDEEFTCFKKKSYLCIKELSECLSPRWRGPTGYTGVSVSVINFRAFSV